MDINIETKRIFERYVGAEKSIFYISRAFVKKVIREKVYDKSKKFGVFGYKQDTDKFLECAPRDMKITEKNYAVFEDWRNAPGYSFKGEKIIKRIARWEIDVLVIVSEDLRYLLQMYLLGEKCGYEIVDIYSLIKCEYGMVLLGGLSNTRTMALKELIKKVGLKMAERNRALSKLSFIKYWGDGRKQYNECDNYDAILVKKNRAESSVDKKYRRFWMKELILNYLLIRDFTHAFYYIDKYNKLYGNDENNFRNLKKEYMDLFGKMKSELRSRKNKDIIIFWCDGMPYSEFVSFGFLNGEAENSLYFENAYTHVAYTHTTSQSIFTGLPFYEHKLFDWNKPMVVEDGKTIDLLEREDYNICEIHSNYIQPKYTRDLAYSVKTSRPPAAMNLWEMLAQLIENPGKKQCIICHLTCELHPPYWNGISRNMKVGSNSVYADEKEFFIQIKESAQYLEKQILWYTKFLGKETCRIYMSDHGHGTPLYKEEKIHTFCFVKDCAIPPGRYSKYFSYLSFYELFQYILQPTPENLAPVFSDYILIQSDHPYSKSFCTDIVRRFENKEEIMMEKWMGFRGIVKDGYKLVLFPTGEEYWFDCMDNRIHPEDIHNEKLVIFMRNRVGTEFADIYASEHYKETRKVYEVLNVCSNGTYNKIRGI